MKKWNALLALALVFIMLFSACGNKTAEAPAPENTPAASETDAKRDDIVISLWAEPLSLCAAFNSKAFNSIISGDICEPLINYNDDGTFTPVLATSWELENGGKDIVFELREGVKFSNGEPMTADDVVFSYNTIIDLGYVDNVTGVMDHMEKVDDSHVRLVFDQAYGPALLCVASDSMCIFPQAYYESNKDTFERNPVGTGPYKLVEWKTGDSITMTANETYWDGPAAIQNVTYKFFTDDSAAVIALESGEVDVLLSVPAASVSRLQNNPDLQEHSAESLTSSWVFFNHVGYFEDENVRLAVAYALNKEEINMGATEGDGVVADSIFPSFLEGASGLDYTAPTNNLELAKEYMANSAYPEGFSVTVKVPADSTFYKPLDIVQAQLLQIGININVEKVETGTWYSDVFETGNYEMGMMTNTLAWADMDDMWIFYHSGAFLNTGNVNYPELDKLWEGFRWTPSGEERAKIGNDIIRYLGDHAIVVPLYSLNNHIAANKDLKGVTAHASKADYRASEWSW